MDGLQWKTLLKWMIWGFGGTIIFGNPHMLSLNPRERKKTVPKATRVQFERQFDVYNMFLFKPQKKGTPPWILTNGFPKHVSISFQYG